MEQPMKKLALAWLTIAALAGCAVAPPVPAPSPEVGAYAIDPLRCDTRSECTTKVSRTLLFVFDYAAAGAPLVQRDGRLLFTPEDAPASDWPALRIELAKPVDGRFSLQSECRQTHCRTSPAALQEAYQHYLMGKGCTWRGGLCLPAQR
jgi:hypothetical protein